MKEGFNVDSLPEAGNRYVLEECVGEGVCGRVFRAKDTQASQKYVAIKIQNYYPDNVPYIQEEYIILRDFSSHPNLPEFYGIYKNTEGGKEEIWFVMEFCSAGPIIDLVKGLLAKNRRMAEEHIALVLKEVIKALLYLHENKILHRDIRASNILLTNEGEAKLADFGLSRLLKNESEKTITCLGSPSWMAPEVASAQQDHEGDGYDSRADVWSLGITAIELGDGRPPFQDMHPSRALFQIVRNPPPFLSAAGNWSEMFRDFISECLVKNPEHRPYMVELLEHPFLTAIPENNYYLTQELKVLCQDYSIFGKELRVPESVIHSNYLRTREEESMQQILVEDLSTLSELSEEVVLEELNNRMEAGQFCTFVGDVLLILNPNEQQDIYGEEQHYQYRCKSRSDNAPHVYSVADSAYQAALHHQTSQHILFAGESSSGKTTNYLHIIDHLLYLGQNNNINQERIKNAIKLLHALTHASTPTNDYSTRCIFHTEIIYGSSGKNTGARFHVDQLEKWRVSSTDMEQSNFHILYYFYDGLQATGELNKYQLINDRQYRYLRIPQEAKSNQPRDNPKQNIKKYEKILEIFKAFEFSDAQIESILNILAAVINIGELKFCQNAEDVAVENEQVAAKIAQLLKVDEKKFTWALTNYCVVHEDTAVRKKHTCEEARDARDILANTLYSRIVQYVTAFINHKLAYGMAVFGEKYVVKVLDFYGFECFKENDLAQFLINCTNELLQYHYLQRVFGWEALETNEENIPYKPIYHYNNKDALEEMLGKAGVANIINEASRYGRGGKYLLERLQSQERTYINKINGSEFCINHYTGKIAYDSKEMPDRNRDFLPPDIIELLHTSEDAVVKLFFKNKINKAGNLCLTFEEQSEQQSEDSAKHMLQYSQTRKMRTAMATFKAFSIDLMKELSVGGGTGGTHFIRCVRSDLHGNARSFQKEIVKQQLRAMGVLETAKARQKGFPHRVAFPEFLRRYKFLAFEFDENVEVTKENCRLLLIRLKMEGWAIGKTKVFLKYYNEEYLSRLYETQVKKVIKMQAMIRSYLAKRKLLKKLKLQQKVSKINEEGNQGLTADEAATVVQKAFRKYAAGKIYGRFKADADKFDDELIDFIRVFYNKWKAKSMFQVLLQYRAAKYQDFYNLCQQVHLYNQNIINVLQQCSNVDLERIDSKAQIDTWLGSKKASVLKLPFRLDEIPYFDTSYMCEPLATTDAATDTEEESWDTPFKWRETVSSQITASMMSSSENEIISGFQNQLIDLPYTRNPDEPIKCLASPTFDSEDEKQDDINYKNLMVESKESTAESEENKFETDYPANKDFEYVRPPSPEKVATKSKPDYINPIVELEIRGKRLTDASDDEPPFNFQAMLRKTNFRRDSMKRETEISRTFSFQNKQLNAAVDESDKVTEKAMPSTIEKVDNNIIADNKVEIKKEEQKDEIDTVISNLDKTLNDNKSVDGAEKDKDDSSNVKIDQKIDDGKLTMNDSLTTTEEKQIEQPPVTPTPPSSPTTVTEQKDGENMKAENGTNHIIMEEPSPEVPISSPKSTKEERKIEFSAEVFVSTEIIPGIFLEGIVVDL